MIIRIFITTIPNVPTVDNWYKITIKRNRIKWKGLKINNKKSMIIIV